MIELLGAGIYAIPVLIGASLVFLSPPGTFAHVVLSSVLSLFILLVLSNNAFMLLAIIHIAICSMAGVALGHMLVVVRERDREDARQANERRQNGREGD